jgi:uncharacterized protein YdeI (YjbR/CyaY-like superfamily)
MARLQPVDVTFFQSPEELRAWLEANHATAADKWVGFRPKASGLPTITWPEVVDEVLCYGWIDSIRMGVEGGSCIRITPRRSGSIWSARNVGRVEALRAGGRMRPAGEAAFAARREDRTAVYSFERDAQLDEVTADALCEAGAWAAWEAQPKGYRRTAAHWIASAKREETQAKRRRALVEATLAGGRVAEISARPAQAAGGPRKDEGNAVSRG